MSTTNFSAGRVIVCSLFLSPPDDDADALAVMELRLRQTIIDPDILVFNSKESDGFVISFWDKDADFSEVCLSDKEYDLAFVREISFRISCRSSVAATNSEEFFLKKTMALLTSSNKSRKNLDLQLL